MPSPSHIDLNCDLGESVDPDLDAEILGCISSTSIACGYHAGDHSTMRRTVERALERGVAIGAHPGFPDRSGFGRRIMNLSEAETRDLVTYQIGALDAFVRSQGGIMRHVKPHGALYSMAASDPVIARAIADAVHNLNAALMLYSPPDSELLAAGQKRGLRVVPEAFADRRYRADGSLVARDVAGAVISDPGQAAAQAAGIVRNGVVATVEGVILALSAETICLHGDAPGAPAFARAVREALERLGVEVRAIDN